jgi:hypothetical protein
LKAIIQHNFKTGLGDFMCDVTSYLNTFKTLKDSGYEIHLIISLKDCKYTNKSFFHKLFDTKTIKFFTSIEEVNNTNYELYLNDCKYHSSNNDPQLPGYHHFDVFFDVVPKEFTHNLYYTEHIYLNNKIPNILPKIHKNIINLANYFSKKLPKDYYFLHIRTSDVIDNNNDRYNRIIKNVKNYIDETNCFFHLGTNNKYIYKNLKNYKNIIVYDFKNLNLINNDMNAYTNNIFNLNIDSNILNERLLSIASEFVSIKNASKIYYISDLGWLSNFLFYAICYKKNKIELINKNIWLN